MARTIFTNGLVFDGSGSPAAPGEVVIEADRVVSVTPGWSGKRWPRAGRGVGQGRGAGPSRKYSK